MNQLQGNGACFSDDEKYRYLLWRTWDASLPRLLWVLLNPSTATAEEDDPTVQACIGYTRQWRLRCSGWQYGGIEIVNLFAFRSAYPHNLYVVQDPIGNKNDACITEAVTRATRIIVAWGTHGSYLHRDGAVLRLLPQSTLQPPYCLDKNQDGSPRHPARFARDVCPIPFD